jgi:hypothetical protein
MSLSIVNPLRILHINLSLPTYRIRRLDAKLTPYIINIIYLQGSSVFIRQAIFQLFSPFLLLFSRKIKYGTLSQVFTGLSRAKLPPPPPQKRNLSWMLSLEG